MDCLRTRLRRPLGRLGVLREAVPAVHLAPARRSFAGANGWALAGSALCGALGLATFYLALDRGKASAVVPLISVYPLITTVLAVAFLNETLTTLQMVGVGCALGGVVLISVGS